MQGALIFPQHFAYLLIEKQGTLSTFTLLPLQNLVKTNGFL